MAITQVRAQIDGVWYALTYDAAQRCYVAEIPAGETSADQPGGYFNVTVEATGEGGVTATLDGGDIPGLRLVVKDLTAPVVALASPSEGYLTTETPEIIVDLTDNASGIDLSTLTVTADGTALTATTEAIAGGYRATVSPAWADGVHSVEISVADNDGNVGTLTLLYTVDTTPPAMQVYDHRLVVDTAEVLIRGYAQDSAGAEVTVSTGDWSATTGPASDGSWAASVPLSVGVNEITVTATDGAGLTSTWTGTVIRLITDRVKADLDALNAILRRFAAGTEMEADWTALNAPNQRGAYNYTDLNRVSAAAELVYQSLVGQGFVVDYDRLVIHPDGPEPDNPLPDGYTELEYIESNGAQYINTGFFPGSSTQIHADFQFLEISAHTALYGQRGASPNYANRFDFGYVVSSNAFRFDFGSGNVLFPTSISWQARYSVSVDGNLCVLRSAGDVVGQVEASDVTFTGGYPLYLFAINTAGKLGEIATLRLYNFQILSGGVSVRNFIPCKNADGVVGLYDSVGGNFYANQGTGSFLAGPEVPPIDPPTPIDPYAWQEGDIPTVSQMAQYLANVVNLLGARLVQEPYITLPTSMAGLTLTRANNIEWALVCVDAVTPVARKSYIYSGEAMAGEF